MSADGGREGKGDTTATQLISRELIVKTCATFVSPFEFFGFFFCFGSPSCCCCSYLELWVVLRCVNEFACFWFFNPARWLPVVVVMEDVTVQPRAHLAIGRQWKSRSVLLLPNFSREKVSLSLHLLHSMSFWSIFLNKGKIAYVNIVYNSIRKEKKTNIS